MNTIKHLAVFVLVLVSACGKGVVDIDDQSFQPKIVIDGTLIPGKPVTDIILSRNYPLNTPVDFGQLFLDDAQATIFDGNGTAFKLTFNSETYSFENKELAVDYGQTYTLEVSANIEGEELFARSTTTVPQAGFEILRSKSVLDSMVYRQRNEKGELMSFEIAFNRSPSADIHALSLTALNADTSTFIYDNAFHGDDVEDVMFNMKDLQYNYTWIQDAPKETGESSLEVFWFFTNFYGEYQAVVYAGDKNFKDFLISHDEVQEMDGNFHEPSFHIEGDGIGVFSSAIADTVYFKVLQN